MNGVIGSTAIVAGLVAAAVGVLASARTIHDGSWRWLRIRNLSALAVIVAAVVAVGVMEWALLTHDFTLSYVAANHARSTPTLYTVASLWGALEGSILLWGLILAGHLWWVARRLRHRGGEAFPAWTLLVLFAVTAFFFLLMAGPADPFTAVDGIAPLDGRGPNPLLQNHPLMAIHPPMLYLGYVGFTVPFAYAVAAMVSRQPEGSWSGPVRRTTLLSWAFLTGGIVLGAWWSYEVLGWGGYFAWDPVENASLLPWITATAYLHSSMAQRRRGVLRTWNLSLVVATFALTILGTFLTRSGVVASVHAFTQSDIGPWLLGLLVAVIAVGAGLVAWRGDELRSERGVSSPLSREGLFVSNNVLLTALMFVVLIGTTFPLLAQAFTGRELSVGEPYFERSAVPIGLALLTIMAVAPSLQWTRITAAAIKRLQAPALLATVVMVTVVAAGGRGVAQIAAFGLGSFVIASTAREFFVAVRNRRRRASSDNVASAALATLRSDRRRYGGLVVHVGVAVVAVALAASQGYDTREEVRLDEGSSATVGRYTLTYVGPDVEVTEERVTVSAQVAVRSDGRDLGVYTPRLAVFPAFSQTIGTPSVRSSLREDLYLTLVASPDRSGQVTLGVFINPMVAWLWLGGGIMLLGAAMAMWPGGPPRRQQDVQGVDEPSRRTRALGGVR